MQHVFSFFQPGSKFFYFSTSSYEFHFRIFEQFPRTCPQCSSYKECTRQSSFKTCASILIIQLRRFTNLNGSLYKDNRVVNCYLKGHQTLTVPSHPGEDISFSNEYRLVATVNHSGTLARGHYWAFVKDDLSDSWWKCDDRAVLKVKPSDLNNSSVYVLFFVKN